MIKVFVQKTMAKADIDTPLTSGSVGLEVEFVFSEDWSGLTKTAVFETSSFYKETAPLSTASTIVPADVMAWEDETLYIGVYGTAQNGEIVIPTVYANCGRIHKGANDSEGGRPLIPAQSDILQNQIDSLGGRVAWLEATGGGGGGAGILLDTTLTQSGAAADAKAVGDALAELEGKIPEGGGGKDGVSATHSWNGTTLTITSASGTSSADLKGDKGDKGDQGIQGIQGEKGETGASGSNGADGKDGANGTSVTVKSVSESTADGGSNVVTFSDGKTLTVKNGSKGSSGTNGTNGTNGVSVSSVTQTTTSSADGGSNVVTVTLSNGTTSTFTVKNGSKGSTGAAGKDGATAAQVIAALEKETWTFTLEDGSTVTKEVPLV